MWIRVIKGYKKKFFNFKIVESSFYTESTTFIYRIRRIKMLYDNIDMWLSLITKIHDWKHTFRRETMYYYQKIIACSKIYEIKRSMP